jgi:hypothetical protein
MVLCGVFMNCPNYRGFCITPHKAVALIENPSKVMMICGVYKTTPSHGQYSAEFL